MTEADIEDDDRYIYLAAKVDREIRAQEDLRTVATVARKWFEAVVKAQSGGG